MKTIVTVLLSSIRCDVFRSPKDEVLMIGSSISHRDCGNLIESCAEILGKLEGHGGYIDSNTSSHFEFKLVFKIASFRNQ